MWDLAFKNIERQKSRTTLTILGIVIGISVIIALGSFAEGINVFFQSTLEFSAGKIMVQQSGAGGFQSGFVGSDISSEQLEMLENIDGVDRVVPVNFYMQGGGMGFSVGTVVVGMDPADGDIFTGENVRFYSGRDLEADDSGLIMVGKTFADDHNLVVGDSVTLKDWEFEVVGIIELTNNIQVDGAAMITISDMQDLLETDTYQMIYVIPEDIKDVEKIAEDITDEDESLSSITDKEFARTASGVVDQIRMFMFGMGGIAVVVGGLGVLNTMIMAVLERRKEIGVMKAIGATRFRILNQILSESILMSLLGGVFGVLLGFLASVGLRVMTDNAIPATVTPELALVGILFGLFLGAIGGIYPAYQASKVDPVEALRYE